MKGKRSLKSKRTYLKNSDNVDSLLTFLGDDSKGDEKSTKTSSRTKKQKQRKKGLKNIRYSYYSGLRLNGLSAQLL